MISLEKQISDLSKKLLEIKNVDERAKKFAEIFKGSEDTSLLADILFQIFENIKENPTRQNQQIIFSYFSSVKGDLIIIKKAITLEEIESIFYNIKHKFQSNLAFFTAQEKELITQYHNFKIEKENEKVEKINFLVKIKEQNSDNFKFIETILQKINNVIQENFSKMILFPEGHESYIKYQDFIKKASEYLKSFEDYMNLGSPVPEEAILFFKNENIKEVDFIIQNIEESVDMGVIESHFNLRSYKAQLLKIYQELKKEIKISETDKEFLLDWIVLEKKATEIRSNIISENVDFSDSISMSKNLILAKAYDEMMREFTSVIAKIERDDSLFENRTTFGMVINESDFMKIVNKLKKKNYDDLYEFSVQMMSYKVPTREVIAKTSIIYQIFDNMAQIKRNDALRKTLYEALWITFNKFLKSEYIKFSFPKDFLTESESNKIRKIFKDIGLQLTKDETHWELRVDAGKIWQYSSEEGYILTLDEFVEKEMREETVKDLIFRCRNDWNALSNMLIDPRIYAREKYQIFFINTISIKEIFFEMSRLRQWVTKPRIAEEILKAKMCPIKAANSVLNSNSVPKTILKSLLKTKSVSPEKQKLIKAYFKRIGY